MRPDEVAQAAQRLAHNGTALGEAWSASKSAIAGNESGIGADRLADAFRSVYTSDSEAARRGADPVPDLLIADGESARTCADEYRAADDRSAEELRAVTGSELDLRVSPSHTDTL
ncbi:hypothetical protein [Actinophytocola gossypii]|uniref:Uncharacterized protein n=1 Tax=Actinophytocola gossypii TaxID=2812003 RepID=A0ABT2J4W7_9PSEU|nr:hypothetical protein [Actinophytocola gossypii]MCT2582906.1 hypothetical protein [Actinophytocola gossypii]